MSDWSGIEYTLYEFIMKVHTIHLKVLSLRITQLEEKIERQQEQIDKLTKTTQPRKKL